MLALPHAHLNTGTPADSIQHYTAWPTPDARRLKASRPSFGVSAMCFPMWSIVTIPDIRTEVVCRYPPRQRAIYWPSRVRRQASGKRRYSLFSANLGKIQAHLLLAIFLAPFVTAQE